MFPCKRILHLNCFRVQIEQFAFLQHKHYSRYKFYYSLFSRTGLNMYNFAIQVLENMIREMIKIPAQPPCWCLGQWYPRWLCLALQIFCSRRIARRTLHELWSGGRPGQRRPAEVLHVWQLRKPCLTYCTLILTPLLWPNKGRKPTTQHAWQNKNPENHPLDTQSTHTAIRIYASLADFSWIYNKFHRHCCFCQNLKGLILGMGVDCSTVSST